MPNQKLAPQIQEDGSHELPCLCSPQCRERTVGAESPTTSMEDLHIEVYETVPGRRERYLDQIFEKTFRLLVAAWTLHQRVTAAANMVSFGASLTRKYLIFKSLCAHKTHVFNESFCSTGHNAFYSNAVYMHKTNLMNIFVPLSGVQDLGLGFNDLTGRQKRRMEKHMSMIKRVVLNWENIVANLTDDSITNIDARAYSIRTFEKCIDEKWVKETDQRMGGKGKKRKQPAPDPVPSYPPHMIANIMQTIVDENILHTVGYSHEQIELIGAELITKMKAFIPPAEAGDEDNEDEEDEDEEENDEEN